MSLDKYYDNFITVTRITHNNISDSLYVKQYVIRVIDKFSLNSISYRLLISHAHLYYLIYAGDMGSSFHAGLAGLVLLTVDK